MRGFSGYLPPEQLLYLWDLILGYDSLEIIPLFAVTILSFRKENIMQVNTLSNVEVMSNFFPKVKTPVECFNVILINITNSNFFFSLNLKNNKLL